MAKGRGGRGPSRMDLRRQNEAAEARESEEIEETEDEETEDEGAEDDESAEVDADADIDIDGLDDETHDPEGDLEAVDDEDAPKKKPKKKAKKAAVPKVKKTKAVKVVRQRAVWKVLDNGGKVVGTFDYPKKEDAEALLAAKIAEKEGKATFYIQLVKEPLED